MDSVTADTYGRTTRQLVGAETGTGTGMGDAAMRGRDEAVLKDMTTGELQALLLEVHLRIERLLDIALTRDPGAPTRRSRTAGGPEGRRAFA